jgi:FHA domain
MSLIEELTALQQEKEGYLERLEKLEARKEKVRPELYDKLRGEIDEKIADVSARTAAVEQQVEQERQAAEEARLQAEEEARLLAAEEAKSRTGPTDEQIAQRIVELYGDELSELKNNWRGQVESKRRECNEYIAARDEQKSTLCETIDKAKTEIEELELRFEIGEFEDNEAEFEQLNADLETQVKKADAEVQVACSDVDQVRTQLTDLDTLEMPDFEAQLFEKYAEEIRKDMSAETADDFEDEEVYEPVGDDDVANGRVVSEEVLDGEHDDVVTEYEEIFEDEVEEGFFAAADARSKELISATINPCLLEEKPDGSRRVYNLVLSSSFAGGKTMIGSREDSDVYLPFPDIAPKHAWVKVDRNGTYYLKDLGSPDGTFVNNKRTKKIQLQDGDTIRIGTINLAVKLI